MLTSKSSKVAKVVICGMKSVGKTAILEQLIYGNVTPDTVSIHAYHILQIIIIYNVPLIKITSLSLYVSLSFCCCCDRNFIQQLKIPTLQVWTRAVDLAIYYGYLTLQAYRELYR